MPKSANHRRQGRERALDLAAADRWSRDQTVPDNSRGGPQPTDGNGGGRKGPHPPDTIQCGHIAASGFRCSEFALADLAAIRAVAEGATINDVILAICSGALRKYLAHHDELPGDTLVAAAPINTRSFRRRRRDRGQRHLGHDRPAFAPISKIRSGGCKPFVITPARRKQSKVGISARVMADVLRQFPGAPLAGLSRLMTSERFARLYANLFITNVRGSSEPLYMHGARLTHQFGMGPLTHGMGLFIAATTYAGTVSIAATADSQLMPDIGFFGECVEGSFAELRESHKAGAKRRAAGKSGRKLRPERTPKKRN